MSGADKLTLSGIVSLLTILMIVGGAFFAMENRYATERDVRTLRCDMVMFQMTSMEIERNQQNGQLAPALQQNLRQMEQRWDRMCSRGN